MIDPLEVKIGEAAGKVWKVLKEKGPQAPATLAKLVALPNDNVQQALGWLAREGKLTTEVKGPSTLLKLK